MGQSEHRGAPAAVTQQAKDAAHAQFDAWAASTRVEAGSRRVPVGLPPGWTRVSRLLSEDGDAEVHVVRFDQGWAVVRLPASGSTLITAAPSLGDLADQVLGVLSMTNGHVDRDSGFAPLARLLLPWYDPTDPVEAAEAALVALGGPLTVIPAAAYTHATPPAWTRD